MDDSANAEPGFIHGTRRSLERLDAAAGETRARLHTAQLAIASALLAAPALMAPRLAGLSLREWYGLLVAETFMVSTIAFVCMSDGCRERRLRKRGRQILRAKSQRSREAAWKELHPVPSDTLERWLAHAGFATFLGGLVLIAVLGLVSTYPAGAPGSP